MTPEGKVKAQIKKFLSTLPNCWFFFPAANGYGTTGIPDIIGCYKGVLFAVEVKAEGKLSNVTPLQHMQINKINQAMGYAVAADCVNTVAEMIGQIDAGLRRVSP